MQDPSTTSTNNSLPTGTPSLEDNVRYGYDRLGFSFTPLRQGKDSKKPLLKDWQAKPRETLIEALQWAKRGNVGLRTGQNSGVVVVDADSGCDLEALNLPGTVTADTGGEGLHLLYRYRKPVGCDSTGKLGEHIHFRGDGGQIVFPGSIHPDTGRRYQWHEGLAPWDVEIAELPEHIAEIIRAPKKPTTSAERSRRRIEKWVQAAVTNETRNVASSEAGGRNGQLNTSAFSLGQLVPKYLDRETTEAELYHAAEACGLVADDGERQVRAKIYSGLTAGMKQPRDVAERLQATETPVPQRQGYILTPGIHTDKTGEYTEQSNRKFADAVLQALPEDTIYRKDSLAGEIIGRPGGRRWVEFSENRMRLCVDTHMRLGKWVKSRSNDKQILIYQPCIKDWAGIVMAHSRQSSRIRELDLLAHYPIYGPGFVRVLPGWHDGIYYDEPAELQRLEPVTDPETIHNILHDLVVDFPFRSQADRENFFGLMLTPLIAPALDGNRPLHLIGASLPRTGKTKLAEEVWGGVIIGRQTPAMQITEREEERDKRVLGLLLTGETMVHLDNLPQYVESGTLASLLTATTYSGRILGGNNIVSLKNHITFVASGNNVQASNEILQRAIPIILQPNTPDPQARRDFHHQDLRQHVKHRRMDVLACLLGLVENWIAAGQPKHADRLGGFENWSGVVGGILKVNGLNRWMTNAAEWRKQADPKGAEMDAFVRLWFDQHGTASVPPTWLRDMAQQNGLFLEIFAKRSEQAVTVAFGRMLQRHINAPIAEWFVRRGSSGNNSNYRLEALIPDRHARSAEPVYSAEQQQELVP